MKPSSESSHLLDKDFLKSHEEKENISDSIKTEPTACSRADHKKRIIKTSARILLVDLCERLAFLSVSANLFLYLTGNLHFTPTYADIVVTIFIGTSYFVPLIGGWLADSIAGKFNVIFGSGLIYVVGLAAVYLATLDYEELFGVNYCLNPGSKTVYFLLGLLWISIGSGGLKPNLGPYGADQVKACGQEGINTFFLWFYWFIHSGTFIALTAVAYIQQNISFCIGFTIPLVSMFIAIVVFRCGITCYYNHEPQGSVLSRTVRIIVYGIRKRNMPTKPPVRCFIDVAKEVFGGAFSEQEVEGVKSVAKLIPIFLTLIVYWSIYAQTTTTFYSQTVHLNMKMADFQVPAASMNLFSVVFILLLIPIMDRVIYPYLKKSNINLTLLKRIGVGYFLATVSILSAAVLEIYRRADVNYYGGISQSVGRRKFNASSLSVFYQTPQFIIFGASEVFTSASFLELAYSQSPSSMKSLIMSLTLMMNGLGNYFSSLVILIINEATTKDPWLPSDINDGYLENVFFLFAVLMVVDLIIFFFLSQWYRYVPSYLISPSESSITSSGSSMTNGSLLDTPKPSVSEFISDKNEYTHL